MGQIAVLDVLTRSINVQNVKICVASLLERQGNVLLREKLYRQTITLEYLENNLVVYLLYIYIGLQLYVFPFICSCVIEFTLYTITVQNVHSVLLYVNLNIMDDVENNMKFVMPEVYKTLDARIMEL